MRSWGVFTALALAIASTACGMAASPSPCRGEVSDPAQAPTHHDPELERRFPATVAGEPFDVQSVCANASNPGGITVMPELLDEIGVPIEDVTYAASGVGDVSVTAYRYRGAAESTIRTAFVDAMRSTGETMAVETRAGKEVDVARGPLASGSVFYTREDTLYILSGVDEQVDELLAGLP